MPNLHPSNRLGATRAEITAAYIDDREDDLLDAVVTAAALVARADGSIEPVERGQMLDFLDRNGFLSVFTRADIFGAFERCAHQLEMHGGAGAAVDRLGRLAGRSPARLVIEAGEHVAAADSHVHPDELRVLQLIRIALRMPSHPSVAGHTSRSRRTGATA